MSLTKIFLYTKMKCFLPLFVCLFVCLYLIQIHISEPISTELCTRLSFRLEEVVVCVGPQYFTLFDIFIFCQEPAQNTGHNMASGPRVIAAALYPWSSRRTLVPRVNRDVADDNCAKSYPWYSRRHLRVEVSCPVGNAQTTWRSKRNASLYIWKPDGTWSE
jgi:hypothetical protein